MDWSTSLCHGVGTIMRDHCILEGTQNKPNSISIQEGEAEVVEDHRYLAAHLDNRSNWKCSMEAVYKNG